MSNSNMTRAGNYTASLSLGGYKAVPVSELFNGFYKTCNLAAGTVTQASNGIGVKSGENLLSTVTVTTTSTPIVTVTVTVTATSTSTETEIAIETGIAVPLTPFTTLTSVSFATIDVSYTTLLSTVYATPNAAATVTETVVTVTKASEAGKAAGRISKGALMVIALVLIGQLLA